MAEVAEVLTGRLEDLEVRQKRDTVSEIRSRLDDAAHEASVGDQQERAPGVKGVRSVGEGMAAGIEAGGPGLLVPRP